MDLFTIASVLIFIALVKFLLSPQPSAINGVYSQPNKWYWFKYCVFRGLLFLRKLQRNRKVTGENAGMGRKSRNSPDDMDQVQPLPKEHSKAVDAVYITGSNEEGQFLVTATARRHSNHIQTILFLRLPEIGFLELPCMPDTSLNGDRENEYAAGGLHIRVIEPMAKWNISFDGKLRLVSTGELLNVKFSLDWKACTGYFDFDTDLHPAVLCDAVAREQWSRKFFDTLKQIHQTHYEQFGDTTGTVEVQGHDPVKVNIRGVRDHSYGNIRDWKQLHRYCMQYISFTDGTCLCIAAISMPATTSRLHCGYIFHPSGEMESVSWCDLEFQNLGEDGPVDDFKIRFQVGSKVQTLCVHVLETRVFYIGEGRDAKIYERCCRFKLGDNVGYGLSEWEYVDKKQCNYCSDNNPTAEGVITCLDDDMNKDGTEPQNNRGLDL